MMLVILLISVASCGLADIAADRAILKEYIDFLSGEWEEANESFIIDGTTLGINNQGQLVYYPDGWRYCCNVYLTEDDDLIFLYVVNDETVWKLHRVK